MVELNGYRRTYRLRIAQPGARTIEVTFPYDVVEKEARSRSLTIKEFIEQYEAVAVYNGFDGVHYSFHKRESAA